MESINAQLIIHAKRPILDNIVKVTSTLLADANKTRQPLGLAAL